MKTSIQNRTNEAASQPAMSFSGQQAPPRVANGRQPVAQSQLDRASKLGHRFDAMAVQPVLTLGPTGDHYEREADRVAGQVVDALDSPGYTTARPQITPVAGSPAVQRAAAGGLIGAASAGSTGPAQAPRETGAAAQGGPVSAEVAQGVEAARGAGSPLPIAIRQPAERVLGADFSRVRVHTTSQADRLSRQLKANAFTNGHDLFFRKDTFEPDSPDGKRLIAHELTHVVQQGRRAGSKIQRSLRVVGHGLGEHGTENDGDVAAIRNAIEELKAERRANKQHTTEKLYRAGNDRRDAWNPKRNDFTRTFNSYAQNLAAKEVTHDRLADRLKRNPGKSQLEFRTKEESHETHIFRGEDHIYTLHGGRSAFYAADPDPRIDATPRPKLRKHGSDKEYVEDDRSVPTRRYAYAVKSAEQLKTLEKNGLIRGRHVDTHNKSVLAPTELEKAMLGYSTPGHEKHDKAKRLPQGTKTLPEGKLPEEQMLFLHQMYGSGESQRGVSATSTAKPLLSNAGEGFAGEGARKLKIDLATIPMRAPGGEPNLVNLYSKLPGFGKAFQAPPQYHVFPKYDQGVRQDASGLKQHETRVRTDIRQTEPRFTQERGQSRSEWSVAKNRELFIRELRPHNVVKDSLPEERELLKEGSTPTTRERLIDKMKQAESLRKKPTAAPQSIALPPAMVQQSGPQQTSARRSGQAPPNAPRTSQSQRQAPTAAAPRQQVNPQQTSVRRSGKAAPNAPGTSQSQRQAPTAAAPRQQVNPQQTSARRSGQVAPSASRDSQSQARVATAPAPRQQTKPQQLGAGRPNQAGQNTHNAPGSRTSKKKDRE